MWPHVINLEPCPPPLPPTGLPPPTPNHSFARCAVAAMLALRGSLYNLPSSWQSTDDPCGGQPNCEGTPLALNQCAWRGITCSNGRVTQIELACLRAVCYNVKGSLPAALANASALQLVDFRGNSIGGRRQSRLARGVAMAACWAPCCWVANLAGGPEHSVACSPYCCGQLAQQSACRQCYNSPGRHACLPH